MGGQFFRQIFRIHSAVGQRFNDHVFQAQQVTQDLYRVMRFAGEVGFRQTSGTRLENRPTHVHSVHVTVCTTV